MFFIAPYRYDKELKKKEKEQNNRNTYSLQKNERSRH